MSSHLRSVLIGTLVLSPQLILAQDQDRDRVDRDHDRDRVIARLEPGTVLPVRTNESIDVDKGDNRVYTGIVDEDVRNDAGRLVIPRGASVELMVRFSQDNDMNLDLESVRVDGQRYGVRVEEKRFESRRDNSVVGNIVGAINGDVRGRAVRVPRDSVVTFRLARPLEIGVPDRGVDRDGHHYHDYYNDRYSR